MKNIQINGKSNLRQALDILKGKTVVSNDRRSEEATAVPFTQKRLRNEAILRPSHGVSYHMAQALEALATSVNYIGGMPHFHFDVK